MKYYSFLRGFHGNKRVNMVVLPNRLAGFWLCNDFTPLLPTSPLICYAKVISSWMPICDWMLPLASLALISCNLESHHAIDLRKILNNFVICSLNSWLKFEADGLLLLRVVNLQTCKIGCVWKPGFIKSGYLLWISYCCFTAEVLKVCRTPGPTTYSNTWCHVWKVECVSLPGNA